MIMIGEDFPNFQAKSTLGDVEFYNWLGESWCLLISFAKDFDALSTDEMIGIVNLMPELRRRDVKPLAISCDTVQAHLQWINSLNISRYNQFGEFPFPIIEDPSRRLSSHLGILDLKSLDEYKCPLAGRAVFLIDPVKKLRLKIMYPVNIGRSLMEIMRVIKEIQDEDRDEKEEKENIKTLKEGQDPNI